MSTRQKIINEIDSCYAQGEWGGEDPQATFRKLRTLFQKYEKERLKESTNA